MAEPGPLCVYEKRDPHIAIIRLNRPEKKNSISRDLYWALDEAWHKAKDDDDVWTIILTGTADAFCSGGDLNWRGHAPHIRTVAVHGNRRDFGFHFDVGCDRTDRNETSHERDRSAAHDAPPKVVATQGMCALW